MYYKFIVLSYVLIGIFESCFKNSLWTLLKMFVYIETNKKKEIVFKVDHY